MANHYDAFLRIQFLICPRWDFSHWNILAALDSSFLQFPRLAHVEQGEFLALLEHGVYFSGADFKVHGKKLGT